MINLETNSVVDLHSSSLRFGKWLPGFQAFSGIHRSILLPHLELIRSIGNFAETLPSYAQNFKKKL